MTQTKQTMELLSIFVSLTMAIKVDKSQEGRKCRVFSRADEKINHVACECPKLAQKEYKRRHDRIGRRIYWEVCGANGIHVKPKRYEHQPGLVIENDSCRIL